MSVDLRPWLREHHRANIIEHDDEWEFPCPKCDDGRREKGGHLWFNVARNVGLCYRCSEPYHPRKLIMATLDVPLHEAIRILKSATVDTATPSLKQLRARVESAFSEAVEEQKAQPVVELPDGTLFCREVPRSYWPAYLRKRVHPRAAVEYGVGWCTRGFYAGRLVVPVVLHGRTVSFVARDMTGRAEKKVLYPKGTSTGRVLFNYDRAKRLPEVVLVESVLDAMHVGPSAMAVFGTTLSDHQLALIIAASKINTVTVLFDGDDAGTRGARKVARALLPHVGVKVATLPRGKDPDDLPAARLRALVEGAPLEGRLTLGGHVRRALAVGPSYLGKGGGAKSLGNTPKNASRGPVTS